MKKKYTSFSNRLTQKVMLTVLVTLVLLSGIILTLTLNAVKAEEKGRYYAIMSLVNEKLGRILATEEICVRNVFDNVSTSLDSPERVLEALEKEIKLNNYIEGYSMSFEPGYYPQYERWFEAYMHRDYDHARNIGSADHDYLNKEWYIKGKETKNGYWTDPFFDEAGQNGYLCSFVMPIYDQRDSLAGVLAGDMSLEWLVKQLQDINHESYHYGVLPFDVWKDAYFYSFIVSNDGTYIAHPDSQRIMKSNVFSYIDQENEEDMNVVLDITKRKRGKATLTIDGVWADVYYAPMEAADWAMAIVVPQRAYIYPALVLIGLMLFFTLIGLTVIYYRCRSNIRQTVSPLGTLARSANEVAKGNFDTPLPVIDHQDEIGNLRDSFAAMRQSLEDYIENIKQNTAKEAVVNHDLKVAWNIQKSMIPKKNAIFSERSDIDLYGYLKPAKSVGGDLYDYFIRNDKLFFCIGDVSGKGIPAALVMVVVHYIFRIVSERYTNPKNIVEGMNEFMSAENKSSMFCTFFLGVLNLKTHELKYCNAGHELPVLINSEATMVPVDHNLPLGLIGGKSFKAGKMQLSPGDVLLLCTDGLKEAINEEKEIFGKERIIASLQKVVAQGPADVKACIHQLVDDAGDFVKDAPQADDLTLLAIKISNSS